MTRFIFVLACLLYGMPARCCDVCGSFMGITPYDNQSSAQFLYRYRSFHGYYGVGGGEKFFPMVSRHVHQPSHSQAVNPTLRHGNHAGSLSVAPSPEDAEVYHAAELRFKYFLHQRVELNLFVPYSQSIGVDHYTVNRGTGLGDISLNAGFHLIRKIETAGWQHRLIFGAGVKAPTGNDDVTNDAGYRINFLLQPGTGSWDGFSYTTYVVGYKNWGTSLTSSLKINGTNRFNEKLDPGYTQYTSFFRKCYAGNWTIIPSVQLYYEHSNGLRMNGYYRHGTSMNVFYAGPGLDVFWKNWKLNLAAQWCVAEEQEYYKMMAVGRMSAGLSYNFDQTDYLFKNHKKSTE